MIKLVKTTDKTPHGPDGASKPPPLRWADVLRSERGAAIDRRQSPLRSVQARLASEAELSLWNAFATVVHERCMSNGMAFRLLEETLTSINSRKPPIFPDMRLPSKRYWAELIVHNQAQPIMRVVPNRR